LANSFHTLQYHRLHSALFLLESLKYAQNALAAGAPIRTPVEELTTLPQTPRTHLTRRLWRLVSSAYPPIFLAVHQLAKTGPDHRILFINWCGC